MLFRFSPSPPFTAIFPITFRTTVAVLLLTFLMGTTACPPAPPSSAGGHSFQAQQNSPTRSWPTPLTVNLVRPGTYSQYGGTLLQTVSPDEIRRIQDLHNHLRSTVATGSLPGFPPASDMAFLVSCQCACFTGYLSRSLTINLALCKTVPFSPKGSLEASGPGENILLH